MKFRRLAWLAALLAALWAGAARLEARVIAPREIAPASAVRLEKMVLEAELDGPKAACVLKYFFYNPGSRPEEVDFLAPLPEGGAVTGLTLLAGDKELPGRIYSQAEALDIYREIVAKLRDPALLEYAGRDQFRARIFPVPAGGRLTAELRFDYLPPKDEGRTLFSFPLAGPLTLKREMELEVTARLRNQENLSGLYSPLAGTAIEYQGPGEALATYADRRGPAPERFQLYFQTGSGEAGGLILSHKPDAAEDGFFIFLAEPPPQPDEETQIISKNIIFALDSSGSMNGPKFTQAKKALTFILERLEPQDTFNLLNYNDRVASWRRSPETMTPANRRSALEYVRGLRSGGSTNIEEALKTAFGQAGAGADYLIFLTDGQPTAGEQNELKLAELARAANERKSARLFAFGVGFDVNARLLDRLSGQAGGTSVFVNPDEDLEAKLSSFFSRLTSPALTRPRLTADLALNRVIPEELPDLFAGQRLTAVGRYPAGGAAVFTLTGRQGDREKKFDYPTKLAQGPAPDGAFIAGLWAQRRIGEIIDQIDLAGGRPNPELVEELTALSKTYGLLTPYTSFLALEDRDIARHGELAPLVADNLRQLEATVGASANAQREFKGALKSPAPASPAPAKTAAKDGKIQHLSGGGPLTPAETAARASEIQSLIGGLPPPAKTEAQYSSRLHGGPSAPAKTGAKAQETAALIPPNIWGGRTFFMKAGRWQEADLTEEDLKKAATVRQFSDEYYALAKTLAPEEMVWLAQAEPLVFKRDGKVYLIEP